MIKITQGENLDVTYPMVKYNTIAILYTYIFVSDLSWFSDSTLKSQFSLVEYDREQFSLLISFHWLEMKVSITLKTKIHET